MGGFTIWTPLPIHILCLYMYRLHPDRPQPVPLFIKTRLFVLCAFLCASLIMLYDHALLHMEQMPDSMPDSASGGARDRALRVLTGRLNLTLLAEVLRLRKMLQRH